MTCVQLYFSTLRITLAFILAVTEFSFVYSYPNLCSDTSSSDVYIRDKTDCSMYYFCHNSKQYEARCPVGFYFNQETVHCEFSENINCNIATDSPGLEGVSIISPAPEFDCPGDGNWPHETACEKFYECTGGEANLGICTERMLFDLRYNECNFPEGVDCGDRERPTDVPGTVTPPVTVSTTTTTQTTTTDNPTSQFSETPETEDPITNTITISTTRPTSTSSSTTPNYDFQCPRPEGNFADPLDCTAFYNCLDNEVIGHQYCPDGLLFNPNIENCDYPWNVDCEIQLISV